MWAITDFTEANGATRLVPGSHRGPIHSLFEGERFTGSAGGDSGTLIELRTAAQAALAAVEDLTKDGLQVRLIGVKQLRAFDTELVVASLVRTEGEMQRFVGSVLATADPERAACLAVLNALNRALGNFLRTDS